MPKLVLRRGRPDETSFTLSGSMVLGRSKENEIAILDNSLSRRHARIDVIAGRVIVTDLGSSNGTFVDGARIERLEIAPGDQIRCGALTFELVADAPSTVEDETAPSITKEIPSFTVASLGEIIRGVAPKVVPTGQTDEQLRRSRDRLEILLKVSELLSSPEPIDRRITKILDLVFEILDVTRGVILLFDDEGRPAGRFAKSSLPGMADEQFWSQSIVNHVVTTGKSSLFRDARLDPRLVEAHSIALQSICASMCVPLRPRLATIGVLYVDNLTRANHFSEDDLDFLAAFGNQAAVAIENARLYKRIEDEAVFRTALLRFFPPATTRRLAEAKDAPLDTIEAEVTAVFADISGYTRMSAVMPPRKVVELLNEYFPAVADVVFQHEGTLEKYIGDALLAIWGAPYGHPEDADRAVRAAVDMHRAVAALNARWASEGKEPIAIHIGINTGTVAAGNIGSERYLQYAAIGDATNMASRICGAADEGEILIAESTYLQLKDRAITVEKLDPLYVKGKVEPLQLYRVLWTTAPDTERG